VSTNEDRHQRRVLIALVVCHALSIVAIRPAAAADVTVWIADEGLRIRRDETGSPASRGEGNPMWQPGSGVRIAALRGETVAFQVIVEARSAPVESATVEIEAKSGSRGGPVVTRLLEHYVEVRTRSRNETRPLESLGWTPAARPDDEEVVGWLPDALVPIEHAAAWCPYPLQVPAGQTRAVWVDLWVPEHATPGEHRHVIRVAANGGELAAIDLTVSVASAQLPYRAASALVFYDPKKIERRLGELDLPERQLWQLFHAHHIDALASGLVSEAPARRLAPMFDGSLFTTAHGYHGPGAGVPPAAAGIGMYGVLGDPRPEALERVREVSSLVGNSVDDLFVYAVDEICNSPRGPGWRALLRTDPSLSRVRAAHTCSEDPRAQDVDLVLMAAQGFATRPAAEARRRGQAVWIYNGQLPRAGTMLLDAPPTSLTLNGWIASAYDIGRWFYWESAFWDDDNRGGRGPTDPFVATETFHNADGDACLYDGLLVYPGKQQAPFAAHSFGFAGVLPSLRLKALRRGIQDASLFALARAASQRSADSVLARIVPAALDDAALDATTPFSTSAAELAAARAELRQLIPDHSQLERNAAVEVLRASAASRIDRNAKPSRALLLGTAATLCAFALFLLWSWRRRVVPGRPQAR
jgi:hypothetical protein